MGGQGGESKTACWCVCVGGGGGGEVGVAVAVEGKMACWFEGRGFPSKLSVENIGCPALNMSTQLRSSDESS